MENPKLRLKDGSVEIVRLATKMAVKVEVNGEVVEGVVQSDELLEFLQAAAKEVKDFQSDMELVAGLLRPKTRPQPIRATKHHGPRPE